MMTGHRPEMGDDDDATPVNGELPTAPREQREPRAVIERIGLAIVALVVIAVFAALGAASYASGESFLALMAGLGALMTAWAGARTLFRG